MKLNFTVTLKPSDAIAASDVTVEIWHNVSNAADGAWEALRLEPDSSTVLDTSRSSDSSATLTFTGSLPCPPPPVSQHSAFTVRYKTEQSSTWRWARDEFRLRDGEIVFEQERLPDASLGNGLSDFVADLAPSLDIKSRLSQTPNASVWSIQGSVGAAGDESRTEHFTLGTPRDFVRYLAIVRSRAPWFGPRQGKSKFALSHKEGGILLSYLRSDGLHVAFLAVSGLDNVLTLFHSNEQGAIVASAKNDNEHDATFHVVASVAPTHDLAIAAVMYEARNMVQTPECIFEPVKEQSPADERLKSCWSDGLTYCTWNGLGQNLTANKIYEALDSLADNGVRISNLIIDDNWQSITKMCRWPHRREWLEFEAGAAEFPQGLKGTVAHIRRKHPHIENVAAWHALFGYWGGICDDSKLARTYKTKMVKTKGERGLDFLEGEHRFLDPDDIDRFYDDFYAFLADAGVTAVKTDAQNYIDCIVQPEDRRRFSGAYQDAWAKATVKHLGGRAISCMSQIPQVMFHSQLPTNRPHFLLRTSDDFYPEIPTSHPSHVFANSHNALLVKYLNVTPDWDMFQSCHDFSAYHAAGRCLSGGPVYITDEPGKHDYHLIRQMSAATTYGRTIALRPDTPGTAHNVYNDYNDNGVLTIGTYHGDALTGSGMLGVFNIGHSQNPNDDETVSTMVSLLEFPGVRHDSHYVIRSFRSGLSTSVLSTKDEAPLVAATLPVREWDILTAHPTKHVLGNTHVGVLGLVDKMTGVAAVTHHAVEHVSQGDANRINVDVALKALGIVGVYISDFETAGRTIGDNLLVTLQGKVVPEHTVSVDGKVVRVDIETAWNEMTDLAKETAFNGELKVRVVIVM